MDSVQCNSCGKQVVPKLWHYRPMLAGSLRYLRTQHICPLCGVCMYESGGNLSVMGKIALIAFALLMLGCLSIVAGKDSIAVNVVLAGVYLYLLFLVRRPLLKVAKMIYRKLE
jgi:hypothetical protein